MIIFKRGAVSALALSAIALASPALADPINYTGTATLLPDPVNNPDNKLELFFADIPMPGDQVSFDATFDPSTIALLVEGIGATGETTQYSGGLTSIEFTIGTTTLSTTVSPGDVNRAGIFATTADPIPADPGAGELGIPFFKDGYSITIGSPENQPRWSANLFFFDALSDLPSADAPSTLPSISDFTFAGFGLRVFNDDTFTSDTSPASFGALLDTLAIVDPNSGGGGGSAGGGGTTDIPEPASVSFLGLGLIGLGFSRKRKR